MIFLEPPFFFWGSVGERLDAPGVLHHVTGRGIEWRKILIDSFLASSNGIRVLWHTGCALPGANDIVFEPPLDKSQREKTTFESYALSAPRKSKV